MILYKYTQENNKRQYPWVQAVNPGGVCGDMLFQDLIFFTNSTRNLCKGGGNF